MKSPLAMSAVVAIRAPTLTWLPAPNITPLPLMIQTRPFAVSVPSICRLARPDDAVEGNGAGIRLGKGDADDPDEIEKSCQLMIAFCELWLISVLVARRIRDRCCPADDLPAGRAPRPGRAATPWRWRRQTRCRREGRAARAVSQQGRGNSSALRTGWLHRLAPSLSSIRRRCQAPRAMCAPPQRRR